MPAPSSSPTTAAVAIGRAPTRRRARRRATARVVLAALGATAVLAAGCSDDVTTTPIAGGRIITGTLGVVRLKAASSCETLLDELRTAGAARVGAYGFAGYRAYAVDTMAGAATTLATSPRTAEDASKASGAPAAGTDYSTTNVQEQGVDEPDVVKTDGTRAYVIAQGALQVVDLRGGDAKLLATVDLGGVTAQSLLLGEKRALVFGWRAESPISDTPNAGGGSSGSAGSTPGGKPATAASSSAGDSIGVAPGGAPRATITDVDLANPDAPKVGRTLEVDGQVVTSRLVGATARVVVRDNGPELPFVYPQSTTGEANAKKVNQQVVRDSTLDDWLPHVVVREAAGDAGPAKRLADCSRVELPTDFAGFGSVSVLTFDVAKPLGDGDAVTVMAGAENVYASAANLYVATTRWDTDNVEPNRSTGLRPDVASYRTTIHQFDIAGTKAAQYVGSGDVDGHLLNQFSMSEHAGVLRVAATKGAPWSNGTESAVTVLRRDGDTLGPVGTVGGLGKGERIYAVRFVGDQGYVVTFRQTDPFYVLDLRDPAAPKVAGELKIPGFSSYLHPLDGELVLGVGQAATDQGRQTGAKVSLYDVRDPAAPAELSTWTLPQSQSGAQWDHHAFLWWPATKQLVLPVQQYTTTGASNTAVVLRLDGTTLTEQGRVTHPASTGGAVPGCPPGAKCPVAPTAYVVPIERAFVAQTVLWTLSQSRLQANTLDTLALRSGVALG